MTTTAVPARDERVRNVIERVRATRAWASYQDREVEQLVAMIERGDYVSAALSVENEVRVHWSCCNAIKGDVLAELARAILSLTSLSTPREKPLICMSCECPLPPHRFIDDWPYNGRSCECEHPLDPLPVGRHALHTIAGWI